MKVALAQINPIVGALEYNTEKIIKFTSIAKERGADLVVFPEMALIGYPPEDLLSLPSFIDAVGEALEKISRASKGIALLVGCVRNNRSGGEKGLFNAAALIQDGELVGFQDKILLPDYDVFSERRYFEPGRSAHLWNIKGTRVAVTICEDIWQHAQAVEYATYVRDPILEFKDAAPDLLINLSASPYYIQQHKNRLLVSRAVAKTLRCPVLYCNQVGGNDSLIFDGYSFIMDAEGVIVQEAKGFEEDLLLFDSENLHPLHVSRHKSLEDLFHALVLGVRDYFQKLGWKKACFGLSGGIDSAVVAVIAREALGPENILALTLPSRFSSPESSADAQQLAHNLGIKCQALSIEKPFESFLELLTPHFQGLPFNTTEENLQARIRGMILMAFSNKFGYLVLSTGNKSEMAMGYSTLYGDMCGGLGVLSDVTKGQVYALAHWINQETEWIPLPIISKPPSAELRPHQKDTDGLPEYSIVDCVLQGYVEEHQSPEEIAQKNHLPLELVKDLVRKIHLNEYKRRQAPPGLRVTKKSFTVGRRFPIVQHWNME